MAVKLNQDIVEMEKVSETLAETGNDYLSWYRGVLEERCRTTWYMLVYTPGPFDSDHKSKMKNNQSSCHLYNDSMMP